MLNLLTERLENGGYRVTTASDAAQEVIQATGVSISLIISDVQMPGFGSGVEALSRLRDLGPEYRKIPVIFVTGLPPEDAQKLIPADDPNIRLIHKPVNWAELQQKIKELTGIERPL